MVRAASDTLRWIERPCAQIATSPRTPIATGRISAVSIAAAPRSVADPTVRLAPGVARRHVAHCSFWKTCVELRNRVPLARSPNAMPSGPI